MFPGQQCATCPAQIWPPRLGIKLLEGAASREKSMQGVYFWIASQKIGAISLVFAQWAERAQSGHINPATPVRLLEHTTVPSDEEVQLQVGSTAFCPCKAVWCNARSGYGIPYRIGRTRAAAGRRASASRVEVFFFSIIVHVL